jgi:hypothetical protein
VIAVHRKALQRTCELVADILEWRLFHNACVCKLNGQADEVDRWIKEFNVAMERGGVQQRRMFAEFFLEVSNGECYGLSRALFPELREGLIKRTLLEWCEQDVQEVRPFFLYGFYYGSLNHLRSALAIDPADQTTRCAIADWLLNDVEFVIRDMPDYLGQPSAEDLRTLEEAEVVVQHITDPLVREGHMVFIDFARPLLQNFLEWAASGHPDLAAWGKENKKDVTYWKEQ